MAGTDETGWATPPRCLSMTRDEVHVWRTRLDRPPEEVSALRAILSPDECARADRFHFEKDRTAYTVARGLLKSLLGSYLSAPALTLEFQYAEHGKPYLDPAVNSCGIRFNISHSHHLALLAFAVGREVGVD